METPNETRNRKPQRFSYFERNRKIFAKIFKNLDPFSKVAAEIKCKPIFCVEKNG